MIQQNDLSSQQLDSQTSDNEYWEKYRVNKNVKSSLKKEAPQSITKETPLQRQLQTATQPFKKENNWEQYEVPEQKTFPRQISEEIPMHVARAAETILGGPGEIQEFGNKLLWNVLRKIPGFDLGEYDENSSIGLQLPKTERFREITKEISGGKTEPKTEGQKRRGEYTETIASLVNPLTGSTSIGRAIVQGTAGEGAKEVIKALGGSEKQQEYGKLGTMFFSGLLKGENTAKSYYKNQYGQAQQAIPANAITNVSQLENELNSIKSTLTQGVSTPSKSAVLKPIDELLNKISGGRISVKNLDQAKRDINELMDDPALLQKNKYQFLPFSKSIDDALELYGTQHNPTYLKHMRNANEAYAATKASKKFSNLMKTKVDRVLDKLPLNTEFKKAIPYAFMYGLYHTGGVAYPAAGYGILKAGEFFARAAKSPQLQKHYAKAIASGIQENTSAFIKELKIIDKINEEIKIRDEKNIKNQRQKQIKR
jgi:hypothetical protein